MTLGYLSELCRPVSTLWGWHHLQSAGCSHLDFPCVRHATDKMVVCLRRTICMELL